MFSWTEQNATECVSYSSWAVVQMYCMFTVFRCVFWRVSAQAWVRSLSHGCWMGLCAKPSGKRFPFSQAFLQQGGTQVHNCTELEGKRETFFWNCFWLNCESIRTVNNSWHRVHSWRGCRNIYLCLVDKHTQTLDSSSNFCFLSVSQFHALTGSYFPKGHTDSWTNTCVAEIVV